MIEQKYLGEIINTEITILFTLQESSVETITTVEESIRIQKKYSNSHPRYIPYICVGPTQYFCLSKLEQIKRPYIYLIIFVCSSTLEFGV